MYPEKDLWIGERATEKNVKNLNSQLVLINYRILHFATHGLVAGGASELEKTLAEPSIVLTPPNPKSSSESLKTDDGLLTASEILTLKLDADWVVLSACNTAAGGAEGAEALSGLAKAFFYAGTRAILVSHWPVYSRAAVDLVSQTFKFQSQGKLSRSKALQSSMLSIISQGGFQAHPSYWAPFIIVGEG